jgi:peptide/nickel transport system permease protein
MAPFLLRRLMSGAALVAMLTFLAFVIFNTIPTNPACLVVPCGPHTTTNDADIRAADHRLGIDRSVFHQYADFVWRLGRHGDLGTTWTDRASVREEITAALPQTGSLVIGGMVLIVIFALPLGCLAALRPGSVADRCILALSIIGLAIHPFVLAIALRDLFGPRHGLLQDTGYCPLLTKTSFTQCGGPLDWAEHLSVAWLVFALLFLPLYVRMIRVQLLDVFQEPWIATARAKGASERHIVVRHALRNAVGPVVQMLAVDAGTAITAAIYIETVFGLHGLGSLAVQAFSGQTGGYDLPLTAGLVATIGALVVLLNLVADAAVAWIDPRIRLEGRRTALIPLPQFVTSRPRARRAVIAAACAVFVSLLLAAVTEGGGAGHQSRGILGTPVRVVHTHWIDSYRLKTNQQPVLHGQLVARVDQIDLGSTGWRVRASIRNATPVSIPVADLVGADYPRQGMSLLVPRATGYGTRQLVVHAATAFSPPLPRTLTPGAVWRGSFSGSDYIPRRATIYVGFGQFVWNGEERPLSFATRLAAVAPSVPTNPHLSDREGP